MYINFTSKLKFLSALILLSGLAIGGGAVSADDAPAFTRTQLEAAAAYPYPTPIIGLNDELLYNASRFYNLSFDFSDYVFGSVTAASGSVFLHSIIQQNETGTVVILHGYLDHSAIMEPLISFFLERNFNVHCIDLPGHGLSEGIDASIQDFHHYGQALEQGLTHIPHDSSKPLILLGHSTGATAILEYLYAVDPRPLEPDRIILLAPLIRNRFWKWAWIGTHAFRPLPIESLRGFAGTATRNQEAIRFADIDPLRRPFTKLSWVRALIDWDKKNRNYGRLSAVTLILQGDADRVLDIDYNLHYLWERIPHGKFHIIPGAEHNLHQETGARLEQIYHLLDDFVKHSSIRF